MSSEENIYISIIVPTFNREDSLISTLEALLKQDYHHSLYEIIVVDDGSTDNTGKRVKSFIEGTSNPSIGYYKKERGGPASARNVGIQKAKGDFILFTGDDIIVTPQFLKEHVGYHKKFSQEKNLAVIGYTVWSKEINISPFMRFIGEKGPQFGYALIEDENNLPFNFFYTSNVSLGANMLKEGNFFDERFPYAAWEDIELAYRLTKQGMRIVFNRNALAYHHHPMDFSSFCERQFKAGYSAKFFKEKHPELANYLGLYCLWECNPINNKIIQVYEYICKRFHSLSLPPFYMAVLRHYYLKGLKYALCEDLSGGNKCSLGS